MRSSEPQARRWNGDAGAAGLARLSDGELLARAAREPQAFAAFYDRYEAPIVGYFARRTRDPEVSADLAAEVFAAALRAASRYRSVSPTAAAWLFTIAHNTLAKSARRGRVEARARRRLGIRESIVLPDEAFERIEAMIYADSTDLLRRLDLLPAAEREAIKARVLDERSYPEIARALETSELVIRKRVSRGLSRLRAELEGSA